MEKMNANINELLKLHNNYLRSNYIKKYTISELEGALLRLKNDRKDTLRRKYIENELIRREEDKGKDEEEEQDISNGFRKGFSEAEWEEWSRAWRKICKQLQDTKREKIRIEW